LETLKESQRKTLISGSKRSSEELFLSNRII
jgi:hypothetical protein